MKKATKEKQRLRRRVRSRARMSGTAVRPRVSVFRSLRGMYVQLIDDASSKTLVAVHSKKDAIGDAGERTGKVAVAFLLGKALAAKAKDVGVTDVVFDRGGFRYQGRVAAVADGAREGGLNF